MAERICILLASITVVFAQQSAVPTAYPAAKQGGQYMHNYYIPPAPSTTPWAPAWSPDGRSIDVAMLGSIWRVDPTLGVGKAFPVDAALGAVDCLEWSGASRGALRVWHHALNNDIAITPTGGEDSITNLHRTKLIGSVRTYAHTDPQFSLAAWLDALRKGRTFFSTGPLLDLRMNGKLPGELIQLSEAGEVIVEGSVHSIAPLSKVVLYRNGAEFKKLAVGSFRERIRVEESSWFSLYAEGPSYKLLDGEYPQAATNAIRVYVAGKPIRNSQSAGYFVRWIDKLTTMAAEWLWWRSEAEKTHVLNQFGEARKVFTSR